jgi:hypothetical protein
MHGTDMGNICIANQSDITFHLNAFLFALGCKVEGITVIQFRTKLCCTVLNVQDFVLSSFFEPSFLYSTFVWSRRAFPVKWGRKTLWSLLL